MGNRAGDKTGDKTGARLVAEKGKFVAESQTLETPEGQAITIATRWAKKELIPMFGPQTALNGLLGAGIAIAMAQGASNRDIALALFAMATDIAEGEKS